MKSEHPESPQYARALAYAHNWIGETYRLWWETAPQAAADGRVEAEKHYDAAMALQQQLHVKAPTDVTAQQELARRITTGASLVTTIRIFKERKRIFARASPCWIRLYKVRL